MYYSLRWDWFTFCSLQVIDLNKIDLPDVNFDSTFALKFLEDGDFTVFYGIGTTNADVTRPLFSSLVASNPCSATIAPIFWLVVRWPAQIEIIWSWFIHIYSVYADNPIIRSDAWSAVS